MPRTSVKAKDRIQALTDRRADSRDIPFDAIEYELGADHDAWPTPRVVENEEVLADYRWFCRPCPLCSRSTRLEPHHLVGGARRSNEHANLIAICRACHNEVQSDASHTQRVWLAKWRTDRWHTDWCRLACLLGRVPDFDSLD